MDVPLSGGRLSRLGSNGVDVYPPRGVSIVGGGPGAGHVKAVLEGGSGLGPRWVVEGPMWDIMAPIAGL